MPTFIDLFCGAGGLSLGFTAAGFEELLSIDNNPAAVATHHANLSSAAEKREISLDLHLPHADVIVGGPPCQGFSSAGRRQDGDDRNSLVSVFAQLIARARPRAFVFENVEGFLTAERGDRVLDLLQPLVAAGYQIHLRKLNAANYGVPQHRKRVIAIGGLGWTPTFPAPSHSAFGAPGAERVAPHLPACPTVLDAIGNLPLPASAPPGCPQGHFARAVESADLSWIEALAEGQTMRDLPPEFQHPSFTRRAFRRVQDGTPTERRGGAPSGVRRLRWDEPCKAITGGARSEFLHPEQHRFLTLRECAQIQTFPEDFVFCGTLAEQARLIGNAVPPALGEAIAASLIADLAQFPQDEGEGRLVTFAPTHATGISPALRHTMERVLAAFGPVHQPEDIPLWL
jgi:DNA (cytosine-5)-methyltransferase 1